ncbi:MAG: molybdate ABC transporter substrate-binding protein [Deltaproteobacteria bacterium]
MKNCKIAVAIVLILLMSSFPALGQEKISVAVAANYIAAFKELAADFETKTKIKVEGTFSSTGNLYSQITNGAPYDIFLSADEKRPDILYRDGLADQPFVYARGQVVLWSANINFCKAKEWQDALKNDLIKKIAIANPVTAPYGTAAQTVLRKTGLWDALLTKLVYGETIAQTFQYASTSAVDAGFCALSATVSVEGKKGCFYAISEAPDIIQSACLLKRSQNRKAAEQFVAFLSSGEAQKIKAKFGYR